MHRFAPLAAAMAVSLLVALAACDDSAEPPTAAETVAVGTLPAELPTVPSTDAASTRGSTVDTDDTAPTSPSDETVPSSAATPETSHEPATSTVGTEPAGPTVFTVELDRLVEDDVPDDLPTTLLRDDTGRLRLDVPREWSDHRTEPSRLADGADTPALAAAPDLTSFLDGYDTPGLTALVVADEPADALDAYAFAEDCLAGPADEYHGDDATGRYEVWESCGGTFNDIVVVAVEPDDAGETVLVLVQVVDAADLAALDLALASLRLDDD